MNKIHTPRICYKPLQLNNEIRAKQKDKSLNQHNQLR